MIKEILIKVWFFSSIGCWSIGLFPNVIWMVVNTVLIIACIIWYIKTKLSYITLFKYVFWLYYFWIILCFIRGIWEASHLTYYHQKNLFTSGASAFVVLFVALCSSKKYATWLLRNWYSIFSLFAIYIAIFAELRLWSTLFTPILLFFFFLGSKSYLYKSVFILLCIALCVLDLEARAPFVKFGLATGCLILLGFKERLRNFILKVGCMIGYAIPFLFFFLAVSGVFNILDFNEYMEVVDVRSSTSGEEVNLYADTRTFIYAEVLESALKNEYVLQGRTFARGNDSSYALSLYEDLSLPERFMNESSILNIFTWEGLVGVVLYTLLFMIATFSSLVYTKNKYIKVMAMYIAFIWAFSWVEVINTVDISYVTFLIMVGMCSSREFQSMSNREFRIWAHQFLPFKKLYNDSYLIDKYVIRYVSNYIRNVLIKRASLDV